MYLWYFFFSAYFSVMYGIYGKKCCFKSFQICSEVSLVTIELSGIVLILTFFNVFLDANAETLLTFLDYSALYNWGMGVPFKVLSISSRALGINFRVSVFDPLSDFSFSSVPLSPCHFSRLEKSLLIFSFYEPLTFWSRFFQQDDNEVFSVDFMEPVLLNSFRTVLIFFKKSSSQVLKWFTPHLLSKRCFLNKI